MCCRIINPIVVAPTVAAVGLAFFSYGFPQAGTCMEISIPQIVLVLIFTLVSPPDPTISFRFLLK
jgi:nucleobase transporter 1/2